MREYMKTLLNGVKKYIDSNQPDSTEECLQSDWEQNDPTTPDFIKNRTHYEEVIDGETTLTIKPGDVLEPSVIDQIWEQRETAKYECDGYPDMQFWIDNYPENGQFSLYNGVNAIAVVRKAANVIEFSISDNPVTVRVTANLRMTTTHKLDIKYIPDEVANRKPLILDANLSDYYGGHPEAGDEALEAIKTGRQILVRVPNASGDNYVASYSPVYMYQLPCDGQYLYLFYLQDEKQDLSALLGQPTGTVLMPTYGEFMMLLSKKYDSNPLES